MSDSKLSLGQKLKIAKERTYDEKRRIENHRKMKADEKLRQEYNEAVNFFNNLKDDIVKKIEDDFHDVHFSTENHPKNYEWFNIINRTSRPPNAKLKMKLENDPIIAMVYDDFKEWLNDNDLTVTPRFSHDGVGVNSWTVLNILPK